MEYFINLLTEKIRKKKIYILELEQKVLDIRNPWKELDSQRLEGCKNDLDKYENFLQHLQTNPISHDSIKIMSLLANNGGVLEFVLQDGMKFESIVGILNSSSYAEKGVIFILVTKCKIKSQYYMLDEALNLMGEPMPTNLGRSIPLSDIADIKLPVE